MQDPKGLATSTAIIKEFLEAPRCMDFMEQHLHQAPPFHFHGGCSTPNGMQSK